MTRKCAICKETNYKNVSSFFSAPKDPKIRKLWQEAIGVENHVVKDETYVCSKHFYSTDIVTHWFSGVPPNVITIKYKKFRLRPGAVPKINICPDGVDPQFVECDSEFEVPRSVSPFSNPLSPSCKGREEVFSIPRQDIDDKSVVMIDFEDESSHHSLENISPYVSEQLSQKILTINNSNDGTKTSLKECEILSKCDLQDVQEVEKNLNHLETKMQMKKSYKNEELNFIDDQIMHLEEESIYFNSLNSNNDTLLFEDLLEAYTEVNLPKGWISFVIPKGHGTTIVYAFTKINKDGIPILEKQVFIKNNMILRCSVKERNIDPLMHNLIKGNRTQKVEALLDVEELIDELNKRQICEGNPILNLVSEKVFREGSNWRHFSCPLIVNNGLTKCSKCASLGKRKSALANNTTFHKRRILERREKVKFLNESITEHIKSVKYEDSLLTVPSETVNLLSEAVNMLDLPKIQKVMIKECFKVKNHSKENRIQFSRTWIFLCLLLYIESPEMYKYMLLNKYMNLPPLFTVRAYLRRVKSDREFYNIFQQSVETFQPFTEKLKAGKSK